MWQIANTGFILILTEKKALRTSLEKSSESASLSLQVQDLCSQFFCIHQMWKHFHDWIHLLWVENGLEFLTEFQPLWIKCSRGRLLVAPGVVLVVFVRATRVVGVWAVDQGGGTAPGLGQTLKGIWPVILRMTWDFIVVGIAGETMLIRLEYVRGAGLIIGLILGAQASMMLLMGSWGHYFGAAPAGLAAVIFLDMHWGVSGSSEGPLLLRSESMGVAEVLWKVIVITFIGAKTRIKVGIVMIRHWVQPWQLSLILVSCYRTGHMTWAISTIFPVQ